MNFLSDFFKAAPCPAIGTLAVSILFSMIAPQIAKAQCPLVCNNVQASLDENCEIEVTWDMLLEGTVPMSCVDDLLVEVIGPNGQPIPTSPIITGEWVNQTLTGKVTYLPNGNFCSGEILVEDKLQPVLVCTDTMVSCFHSTEPSATGYPLAIDNCTDTLDLNFSDNATPFNCANSDTVRTIIRTWTAMDSSGNSGSCNQIILVTKPSLDSISMPLNFDDDQHAPLYCPAPNTGIVVTGVPNFAGIAVDSICSFLCEYEDVEAPICDGSYTIFRQWTVYDGCAGESMEHEQIINVMDTLPPDLSCPADITVTTGNNNCNANVTMPQPATYDSCSTIIALSLENSFGTFTGTSIPNLPQGVYPTTCTAVDDCGNTNSCLFTITVKDNVPPVAVGVNNPSISLLPSDPTYLPASTFNGGSWDNCTAITLAARRLDSPHCPGNDSTPFDTLVPFYCCDAGKTVAVLLRVTDVEGNTSMVTSMAHVQDNLEPELECPPNLAIDCGVDYLDLSITGEPLVTENCSGFNLSFDDDIDLDACGEGTVLRTWTVTDIGGFTTTCNQEISIENLTPFYINPTNPNDPNDDIVWPANYISTTCGAGLDPEDLPAGYGYPEIELDSFCQLIAVSYDDTYLNQPNNACIEILRKWVVIDWCQFNQTNFDGSWQYAQIIRIQNSQPPVITSTCEDQAFCSFDAGCQTSSPLLFVTAEDDCTPDNQLEFSYEIDYFNDGTINVEGTGSEVETEHPIGTHRIIFAVEDRCNNTTTCSYLFSITDCKEPTPVCEALIVEITDTGNPTVAVLAKEFDGGSYDNCSANHELAFTFSNEPTDTMRQIGCTLMGMNEVEIWVTDEEGNQDFCIVELQVQANTGACGSIAIVSGTILTEAGDSVSMANILVNSSSQADSMTTGPNGYFQFANLNAGGDYTITPTKDINPLNGVTTFDLVLITRHILGSSPLNSPYKIIAADANHSGAVTTSDLVALRKLILNINTDFTNNSSWRFVEKSFVFSNQQNPFLDVFPEITSINDLSADVQANFVAIKVGDVNGSANAEN